MKEIKKATSNTKVNDRLLRINIIIEAKVTSDGNYPSNWYN